MIIDGAFEIAERTLDQVLRPRPDVFVLDADWTADRALHELAASGHSRAPVAHDRNLDDVVGVVHLRDLLDQGDAAGRRELAGELVAFPETAGVLDVLREMQARRLQLALVVDEHGAVAGIVTMEDLLEELVGEIYDETDRDVVSVRREPDGSLVLPGPFPVHDLVDVGVDRHARGAVRHGRRPGARPAGPGPRGAGRPGRRWPAARSRCWRSTAGPSPRCASAPGGPRPHPTVRPPMAAPTRRRRAAASPLRPADVGSTAPGRGRRPPPRRG